MTLGADTRQLLSEVGTAFTILRDSGNIEGEFLDYELNAQITKPFIRETFLDTELQDNTQVIVGDVVQFDTSSDKYLVMNKSPEMWENVIVKHPSVLYKVNASGELTRPVEADWEPQTYHKTINWQMVKDGCCVLMTEALFGHELVSDEDIGQFGLEQHEIYIPKSVGAMVNDRYQPVSGEDMYVRLESKKSHRYVGVDVFTCGEDNR